MVLLIVPFRNIFMIDGSVILKKAIDANSPVEAREGAKRIAMAKNQSCFIKYLLNVYGCYYIFVT